MKTHRRRLTRIATALGFVALACGAIPAAARERAATVRAATDKASASKNADLKNAGSKNADPAPDPVSAEPQTTTASFGDWVVRCVAVGAPARRSCEASQSLVVQYQGRQVPFAQIAFGRSTSAAAAPLQMTVLLPTNISFDKPARLGPDEAHLVTLPFRRCLPSGCYASTEPDASTMNAFRSAAKPGRLVFTDGGEHTLTLPVSLRGLLQALDALAKER